MKHFINMENNVKEYSNGEVTVVWQPGKCIHSGNCVRNLPSVFKPKEQPWVKIHSATSEEIINAVAKCPSGALSMKEDKL
jgi:uncharacterized Fe-S cluster protein YjdI